MNKDESNGIVDKENCEIIIKIFRMWTYNQNWMNMNVSFDKKEKLWPSLFFIMFSIKIILIFLIVHFIEKVIIFKCGLYKWRPTPTTDVSYIYKINISIVYTTIK